MKGLVLVHMGRREEGIDLVKKGVRLDLTSHIVWHVFGLIQKGEKNYEEALKSYSQALRFDKVRTLLGLQSTRLQGRFRRTSTSCATRHRSKPSCVRTRASSKLVIPSSDSAPTSGNTGLDYRSRTT